MNEGDQEQQTAQKQLPTGGPKDAEFNDSTSGGEASRQDDRRA
jgi:hypothetical protein